MDIKYNIYYALTSDGPWTLANDSPLDHVPSGNSYTVSGLSLNTDYYISIIGGIVNDDDDFVPYVPQFVGPLNQEVATIGSSVVPHFLVRTYGIYRTSNTGMMHMFTIGE